MRAPCLLLLAASTAALPGADPPAAPAALSGDEILSRLVDHNLQREGLLRGYSVRRSYSATNPAGKLYAAEEVRMSFAAPGEKRFEMISGHGSRIVRDLVFNRLRDTEAVAARGRDRTESAITAANYRFEALGFDEIGGRACYLVEATPLTRSKYLFEGRVWVDAEDFAVARIAGHPAANPSFWTRHVQFVRSYGKVGDFWLPSKDETVADIRFYGRKLLNIEHYDYLVQAESSQPSKQ